MPRSVRKKSKRNISYHASRYQPPAALVTAEVPSNDLMRTFQNFVVTSNDMEMVLEAFKTNTIQRFSTGGDFTISDVIRLTS